MNVCPICENHLEKGYIKSTSHILTWNRTSKNITLFKDRWVPSDSEILLAKFNLLKGATVEADMCPSCKKIYIDIPVLK